MSDYMFILESHLTPEQIAVLNAMQAAAAEANLSLFLTGGAMRDILGGFPIRDLDFTVEGPALKLAKELVKKGLAELVSSDEHRKVAELKFKSGVRSELGMARQEKYGKPGARPQVTAGLDSRRPARAGLHDERDCAVAEPGLAGPDDRPDQWRPAIWKRKELRAISNYSLYDDPVRLLRLIRFRARLGFQVEERTAQQFRNVREAGLEKHIPARALYGELRQIALEPSPYDVLKALEEEGLLKLFSPALAGDKLNVGAFQRLAKTKALIPFGANFRVDWYALTLSTLTAPLTAKERTALIEATAMTKEEAAPWQKLEAKSKKLEGELKSAKLTRGSHVYALLKDAPGEEVLTLAVKSNERIVQDRLKNYFTRYLPTAVEVTDAEVTEASGLEPGTAKFEKARDSRIAGYLDGRIKRPVPPPPPEPTPPPPVRGPMVRGARFR